MRSWARAMGVLSPPGLVQTAGGLPLTLPRLPRVDPTLWIKTTRKQSVVVIVPPLVRGASGRGVSPPVTKGEALLRAGDLRISPIPLERWVLASVPLMPGFHILLGG